MVLGRELEGERADSELTCDYHTVTSNKHLGLMKELTNMIQQLLIGGAISYTLKWHERVFKMGL